MVRAANEETCVRYVPEGTYDTIVDIESDEVVIEVDELALKDGDYTVLKPAVLAMAIRSVWLDFVDDLYEKLDQFSRKFGQSGKFSASGMPPCSIMSHCPPPTD